MASHKTKYAPRSREVLQIVQKFLVLAVLNVHVRHLFPRAGVLTQTLLFPRFVDGLNSTPLAMS